MTLQSHLTPPPGHSHTSRTPSAVLKRVLNAFLALSDETTILTPGVHNGHPLGLAQIQELVETYNPQAQPAPLKLTHADKQKEAYGWIKSLRTGPFTPPGQTKSVTALYATLSPTEAGRQANRSGGYRMKSLEAWPPTHPSNPTPGRWHLKALALLGSDSPACPNLGPLELSADPVDAETPVLILQDTTPTPGGEPLPNPRGATMALTPEEQAALDKAKATETQNKELLAKLEAQSKDAAAVAVQARLDGLVQGKRITPAAAATLKTVLLALPDEGEVQLAAGKTATPREALLSVLNTLGPMGLFKTIQVPAESPVELAAGDTTKAMEAAVAKHKAAGKPHAEAVALAAKEVDQASSQSC